MKTEDHRKIHFKEKIRKLLEIEWNNHICSNVIVFNVALHSPYGPQQRDAKYALLSPFNKNKKINYFSILKIHRII